MFDVFFDALVDALKLIPFLFLAFLLIEYFEHKLSNKSLNAIKNTKKGPLFGSLLGLLPQCGFSVIATNLYVTRVITLGTLISIYLSTSDEMLPILIAKNVSFSIIGKILFFKFIVGLISGIVIDLFFCRDKNKSDYHICSDDHCDCEHNIFKSACIHTLKTFIFILVINIVLNLLFEVCGYDMISKIFMKNSFLSVFISSFIGLIPNCAASIIICELFLNDIIGFGALISGLLAGSGVAIILLFKSNNNIKDSFKILGLLYFISSFVGLIIYLFEL